MVSPAVAQPQFKEALEHLIIPSSMGRITNGRYFGSNQVVVNIQDLHCHPEVQRNISKILGELDEKYHLKTVFLEGGYGSIDTSWLRNIKDSGLKKDMMETLVDQGRLTGVEYFAVTGDRPDLLKGLEDEALHKGNIQRLEKILEKKEYFTEKIKQLDKDMTFLQVKYLSARNHRFNAVIERYKSGRMDAEKYYKILAKYAANINNNPENFNSLSAINMLRYPNIQGYGELTHIRNRLPYKRISRQLQGFMGALKTQLPFSVYNYLIEKTGNFSQLDKLYVALSKLSQEYHLDLSKNYPDLEKFFAYINKSQSVNPLLLIKEEKELTEEIRIGFAQDISELEVSFASDFYSYFKDYLFNRLSADDYQYFTERIDKFKQIWTKYTYSDHLKELEPDESVLDAYYATNADRNNVFINKILGNNTVTVAASPAHTLTGTSQIDEEIDRVITSLAPADMNAGRPEIIVVVTGGFHTEGLEDLLNKRKISHIAITPNVTQDTSIAGKVYQLLIKKQAKALAYISRSAADVNKPTADPAKDLAKSLINVDFKHSDALGPTIESCLSPSNQIQAALAKIAAAGWAKVDLKNVDQTKINEILTAMGYANATVIVNDTSITITIANNQGQQQTVVITKDQETQTTRTSFNDVPVAVTEAARQAFSDWLALAQAMQTAHSPATPMKLMVFLMSQLAENNGVVGQGVSPRQSPENQKQIAETFNIPAGQLGKLPEQWQNMLAAVAMRQNETATAGNNGPLLQQVALAVPFIRDVAELLTAEPLALLGKNSPTTALTLPFIYRFVAWVAQGLGLTHNIDPKWYETEAGRRGHPGLTIAAELFIAPISFIDWIAHSFLLLTSKDGSTPKQFAIHAIGAAIILAVTVSAGLFNPFGINPLLAAYLANVAAHAVYNLLFGTFGIQAATIAETNYSPQFTGFMVTARGFEQTDEALLNVIFAKSPVVERGVIRGIRAYVVGSRAHRSVYDLAKASLGAKTDNELKEALQKETNKEVSNAFVRRLKRMKSFSDIGTREVYIVAGELRESRPEQNQSVMALVLETEQLQQDAYDFAQKDNELHKLIREKELQNRMLNIFSHTQAMKEVITSFGDFDNDLRRKALDALREGGTDKESETRHAAAIAESKAMVRLILMSRVLLRPIALILGVVMGMNIHSINQIIRATMIDIERGDWQSFANNRGINLVMDDHAVIGDTVRIIAHELGHRIHQMLYDKPMSASVREAVAELSDTYVQWQTNSEDERIALAKDLKVLAFIGRQFLDYTANPHHSKLDTEQKKLYFLRALHENALKEFSLEDADRILANAIYEFKGATAHGTLAFDAPVHCVGYAIVEALLTDAEGNIDFERCPLALKAVGEALQRPNSTWLEDEKLWTPNDAAAKFLQDMSPLPTGLSGKIWRSLRNFWQREGIGPLFRSLKSLMQSLDMKQLISEIHQSSTGTTAKEQQDEYFRSTFRAITGRMWINSKSAAVKDFTYFITTDRNLFEKILPDYTWTAPLTHRVSVFRKTLIFSAQMAFDKVMLTLGLNNELYVPEAFGSHAYVAFLLAFIALKNLFRPFYDSARIVAQFLTQPASSSNKVLFSNNLIKQVPLNPRVIGQFTSSINKQNKILFRILPSRFLQHWLEGRGILNKNNENGIAGAAVTEIDNIFFAPIVESIELTEIARLALKAIFNAPLRKDLHDRINTFVAEHYYIDAQANDWVRRGTWITVILSAPFTILQLPGIPGVANIVSAMVHSTINILDAIFFAINSYLPPAFRTLFNHNFRAPMTQHGQAPASITLDALWDANGDLTKFIESIEKQTANFKQNTNPLNELYEIIKSLKAQNDIYSKGLLAKTIDSLMKMIAPDNAHVATARWAMLNLIQAGAGDSILQGISTTYLYTQNPQTLYELMYWIYTRNDQNSEILLTIYGKLETILEREAGIGNKQEQDWNLINNCIAVMMDIIVKLEAQSPDTANRLKLEIVQSIDNNTYGDDVSAELITHLTAMIDDPHVLELLLTKTAVDTREAAKARGVLNNTAAPKTIVNYLKTKGLTNPRLGFLVINYSKNKPDVLRLILQSPDMHISIKLYALSYFARYAVDEKGKIEHDDTLNQTDKNIKYKAWDDEFMQYRNDFSGPSKQYIVNLEKTEGWRDWLFNNIWLQDEAMKAYIMAALIVSSTMPEVPQFSDPKTVLQLAAKASKAIVRDYWSNANSGFVIGGVLMRKGNNRTFFEVLAHEIAHSVLYQQGYRSDNLLAKSIHEFTAECAAFAFADMFGWDVNEFMELWNYENTLAIAQHYNYQVEEEHNAARAAMAQIIKHFLLKNLRWARLLNSIFSLIYKKQIVDFSTFIFELLNAYSFTPSIYTGNVPMNYADIQGMLKKNLYVFLSPDRLSTYLNNIIQIVSPKSTTVAFVFSDDEMRYQQRISSGWPKLLAEIEKLLHEIVPNMIHTNPDPTHATATTALTLPFIYRFVAWVAQGLGLTHNLDPQWYETELGLIEHPGLTIAAEIIVAPISIIDWIAHSFLLFSGKDGSTPKQFAFRAIGAAIILAVTVSAGFLHPFGINPLLAAYLANVAAHFIYNLLFGTFGLTTVKAPLTVSRKATVVISLATLEQTNGDLTSFIESLVPMSGNIYRDAINNKAKQNDQPVSELVAIIQLLKNNNDGHSQELVTKTIDSLITILGTNSLRVPTVIWVIKRIIEAGEADFVLQRITSANLSAQNPQTVNDLMPYMVYDNITNPALLLKVYDELKTILDREAGILKPLANYNFTDQYDGKMDLVNTCIMNMMDIIVKLETQAPDTANRLRSEIVKSIDNNTYGNDVSAELVTRITAMIDDPQVLELLLTKTAVNTDEAAKARRVLTEKASPEEIEKYLLTNGLINPRLGYLVIYYSKKRPEVLRRILRSPNMHISIKLYALSYFADYTINEQTNIKFNSPLPPAEGDKQRKALDKEFIELSSALAGPSKQYIQNLVTAEGWRDSLFNTLWLQDEEAKVHIMATIMASSTIPGVPQLHNPETVLRLAAKASTAIVRDYLDNAYSNFIIGGLLRREGSNRIFFEVVAHEIAHDVLNQKGYHGYNLLTETVHEFAADCTALAFADMFGWNVHEYMDFNIYAARLYNARIHHFIVTESHWAARATLALIMNLYPSHAFQWARFLNTIFSVIYETKIDNFGNFIDKLLEGYSLAGSIYTGSAIKYEDFAANSFESVFKVRLKEKLTIFLAAIPLIAQRLSAMDKPGNTGNDATVAAAVLPENAGRYYQRISAGWPQWLALLEVHLHEFVPMMKNPVVFDRAHSSANTARGAAITAMNTVGWLTGIATVAALGWWLMPLALGYGAIITVLAALATVAGGAAVSFITTGVIHVAYDTNADIPTIVGVSKEDNLPSGAQIIITALPSDVQKRKEILSKASACGISDTYMVNENGKVKIYIDVQAGKEFEASYILALLQGSGSVTGSRNFINLLQTIGEKGLMDGGLMVLRSEGTGTVLQWQNEEITMPESTRTINYGQAQRVLRARHEARRVNVAVEREWTDAFSTMPRLNHPIVLKAVNALDTTVNTLRAQVQTLNNKGAKTYLMYAGDNADDAIKLLNLTGADGIICSSQELTQKIAAIQAEILTGAWVAGRGIKASTEMRNYSVIDLAEPQDATVQPQPWSVIKILVNKDTTGAQLESVVQKMDPTCIVIFENENFQKATKLVTGRRDITEIAIMGINLFELFVTSPREKKEYEHQVAFTMDIAEGSFEAPADEPKLKEALKNILAGNFDAIDANRDLIESAKLHAARTEDRESFLKSFAARYLLASRGKRDGLASPELERMLIEMMTVGGIDSLNFESAKIEVPDTMMAEEVSQMIHQKAKAFKNGNATAISLALIVLFADPRLKTTINRKRNQPADVRLTRAILEAA